MSIPLTTNLLAIKNLIASYEAKYQRAKDSVQLLAASKGQSIEKIQAAYTAGQRLFGENYLQEALPKMTSLPQDIEWHFIGPIQSNKTRKIAEHFAWVQSIADINIAKRLHDQRPVHLPPLNICIEVNISGEASKSGVLIENVMPLATACLTFPHLTLRGLMTIPAPTNHINQQRQAFHTLFVLWQNLRTQGFSLDTLSMGMSDDFEAAIAEGATMLRIGRAIFGERTE